MKKLLILALTLIPTSLQAQTYTQMQWGMDKTVNPYNFGANINGTWRDLGTVSSAGVWSLSSTAVGFTQSGTGAVASTVNAKLKSLEVNALDFGVVVNSAAAATTNCSALTNAMTLVDSLGGGLVRLPAGYIYTSCTIDNKYPDIIVSGPESAVSTFHDAGTGFPTYATTILPTFSGTVLKHRTPYAGVTQSNYTGGGFKYIRVDANGLGTRLLDVDTRRAGTYKLALYNSVGTEAARFINGVSGVDIGESADNQYHEIELFIRQLDSVAARAANGVYLTGSSNANFSFNHKVRVTAQIYNGIAMLADNADNNIFDFVCYVVGPSGKGVYFKGKTATNYVGASYNRFISLSTSGASIYAEGTDTPGVIGALVNSIDTLDTANNPVAPTAGTGSIWRVQAENKTNVTSGFRSSQSVFSDNSTTAATSAANQGTSSVLINNGSNNHLLFTDTVNNKWGLNIEATTGNFILSPLVSSSSTFYTTANVNFVNPLTMGTPGTQDGTVNVANGSVGGANVTIKNPSTVSGYNFNLPASAGTATYLLTSQGGGSTAMSWTNPTMSINGASCTLGGSCTVPTASIPFPQTVSGAVNSGGIPYFNSVTQMSSSATLAANSLVIGGGSGVAPSTTTTGTGVVSAIANNTNSANGLAILNASGYLAVGQGGTGIGSGNSGGIPYFSDANTIASSAALAANSLVIGGGSGVAPSTTTTGANVLTALANNVNTNGGVVVPSTALAQYSLVVGGGSGTGPSAIATGTSGQHLTSNGAAANPSWTTATFPSTTSAGTVLTSATADTVTASATPKLGVSGTTNGTLTLASSGGASGAITLSPASSTSAHTATLPANTGTVAELNLAQTFTAYQTFKQLLFINDAAGVARQVYFTTSGSTRFSFGVTSGAESGSNLGSDFAVARFDDAGAYLGIPLFMRRDNGNVGINQGNALYTLDVVGDINASATYRNNGKIFVSATAPTISSGFGTSPSITANNGTAAFRVNVGTGGTATNGVIGLPTANAGWNCFASDITTPATGHTIKQTATSTTSVTLTNYNNAGTATAWTASDIIIVNCSAY